MNPGSHNGFAVRGFGFSLRPRPYLSRLVRGRIVATRLQGPLSGGGLLCVGGIITFMEQRGKRKRTKLREKATALACLPLWVSMGVVLVGWSLLRPPRKTKPSNPNHTG